MQKRFKAKVVDGKLAFYNPKEVQNAVLALKEGDIAVSISKWTKPRSTLQNRYYWGIIVELLSDYFGYTPEEMHEAIKYQFLLDRTGKLPRAKSTTELTTVEMENFLSKIRIWASSEYSLYIPDPNEIIF
jgi:hypothetical protein